MGGSNDKDQKHALALEPSADATGAALLGPASEAFAQGIDLVPDGLIPTTAIATSILRSVFGSTRVRLLCIEQLAPSNICDRPLFFSRVCAAHLAWLPRSLVRSGARYCYFLDDDFWEYAADNEVARYYARPEVRKSLDAFIRHAAAVIVPSDFLAEKVRIRFSKVPVFSLPAPFDFDSLEDRPKPAKAPDRALRVGYAGSERGSAFDAVSEAIQKILEERPGDIVFEFIGYMPEQLVGCRDVTHFPVIHDYEQFLAFKQSREWDVGLAPLSDNAFCRAKTNNKFREYGGLSIAGIYSSVEPYRGCVTDGITGLLVGSTSKEWYEALLQMLDDRQACARIGSAARAYVWEHHRLQRVAADWEAALMAAKLTPVCHRRRLERAWLLCSAPAKLRARLSLYHALCREQGFKALLAHFVKRAAAILLNKRS